MKIEFHKYEGTGNDFIIIDNRNLIFTPSVKLISYLCHRRFGIGADGLILLNHHDKYNFEMKYYNADGKEGTMCGNGGRCIIAFAKHIGLIDKCTEFISIDGVHKGHVIKEKNNQSIIKLLMNNVEGIKTHKGDYFLNTGSPHYIKFVKKLNSFNVESTGKEIRKQRIFDNNGVNVNFVEIADNKLFVRTYERGVENETLSCGTGATASAIAATKIISGKNNFEITTKGGNLKVSFTKEKNKFTDIYLEGPATFVYKGNISIF